MLTLNVPPFIQAPENRRQKSTSYFPYIMYNTKKSTDLSYGDVQYGKKYGFQLYNTGKIVYGHMS